MSSFLGRDQLLAKTKRRFSEATLPDGDKVRIRSLTERERSKYESETLNKKGELNQAKLADAKRRLIAICVCDSEGNTILTADDVRSLEEVDSAVTQTLYDAIRQHCGFDQRDVEELVKNSEGAPAAASPTS